MDLFIFSNLYDDRSDIEHWLTGEVTCQSWNKFPPAVIGVHTKHSTRWSLTWKNFENMKLHPTLFFPRRKIRVVFKTKMLMEVVEVVFHESLDIICKLIIDVGKFIQYQKWNYWTQRVVFTLNILIEVISGILDVATKQQLQRKNNNRGTRIRMAYTDWNEFWI